MERLATTMAAYAVYHRNRWNRATHFVGVPAIVFALLVPMSWVPLGAGTTLAHAFLAAVLLYYLSLDVAIALVTAALAAALLYAAQLAAAAGPAAGWTWCAALFVGGWILQLAGHVVENRRPALADNLTQVFVAPIFLVAEAFFALGLKRDLHERMKARIRERLA